MARPADYRAADLPSTHADAYTRPAFTLGNRLRRLVWNITWLLLFRLSPRPFHAWRAMLLRLFGATLGPLEPHLRRPRRRRRWRRNL